MLGKSEIKFINSLKIKKYRYAEQAFLAEGKKLILNFIHAGISIKTLVGNENWLSGLLKSGKIDPQMHLIPASERDMKKISSLKTPQSALAVVHMPAWHWDYATISQQLSIALDSLQDPGNMGTIVRLADWFGIRHIFCSKDTVDIFNPKVVQATMGAISNVQVHYEHLPDMLQDIPKAENFQIYGAFQQGKPVYTTALTPRGMLVLGNEGNGIRPETEAFIPEKLSVPVFPGNQAFSESLNVAMAAAVIVSEFRRAFYG